MTDLQTRIAELSPEQRAILERRLADLAATRPPGPSGRIRPRDRSTPAPLAYQQEREWAIGQFRSANNIPGAFRVTGVIDVARLEQVLAEIVARHEVLRSTVELRPDGVGVQIVHPAPHVSIPVSDLTQLTSAEQDAEVQRRWMAEVTQPFGAADPLRLRVNLLRTAPDEHVVLITTEHPAADLVSMALLVKELATLYAARSAGADNPLPPLEIQYGDFAAWQRAADEERTTAALDHWKRALEGIRTGFVLPSDRPYPARPRFDGGVHPVDLPADFAAELGRFIERERISLGVVLLAALSVLLHRYVDQDDVIVGELVSGRNRVEIEQLIGCFISAIPLRMRVSGEQTLAEVVRQARDIKLAAYEHQDLPFDRLSADLELGRETSQTSMSHVWIDVRTPESSFEVPGLRISAEPMRGNAASAPLTVHAYRDGTTLQLHWSYMAEMFDADTVELFADQFDRVLRQVVHATDTTVSDVAVDAAVDRVRQLRDGVDGSTGGVTDFVTQFRHRVTASPDEPAVLCDGAVTTYAQLDREANRIAHRLRAIGVCRDDRVAILVDRSPRLAASILGVLKAGGAYVPLDPTYPAERIAFMLTDAGACALITEDDQLDALSSSGAQLPTQLVLATTDSTSDADPAGAPDPADLAYVVYTSGSTGQPKGTMIQHGSLARFAEDIVERLELRPDDRFLQFASPSFDVLVEELFPTWLAGGAVVIPTAHMMSGEGDLNDVLEQHGITVVELPTAYWHEWVRELDRMDRELPESLRTVIIGGERVLAERLGRWRRHRTALLHVYGLTETTVSSTFYRLAPDGSATEYANLPIGTALPGVTLRVLDRHLRHVPAGGIGELYIGGGSVARGYLGRPDLTAARFVADPYRAGERLYRTGDLVRRRADGDLEFHSRVDTQVKIRGFRVEPAEIESCLSRHPDLAASAVALHEPAPGDRRLVAYLVARPGAAVPTVRELRAFIEHDLPAYMVPSVFVELDALPLNANGKVDRARLPEPDGVRPDMVTDYVAPQTPVQEKLADIVAGVVGVARIGIEDNFFEIGGDSILAIQVVARAQEQGIRIDPYDLFAQPTVAALSAVATAGPTIDAEQGDVSGPVPLAPVQRWFAARCADGTRPPDWYLSVAFDVARGIDAASVEEAVERVLAHHDALRQRILLAGSRSKARIAARGDATPFTVHNDFDPADVSEAAEHMSRELNLAVGPMLRTALFRLDGTRPDRLVLVVHRMVADEESVRILVADLRFALDRLTNGEPVALPSKTTSWQSWSRRLATYARGGAVEAERAYWTELARSPAGRLGTNAADREPGREELTITVDAAQSEALLTTAPEVLNCTVEEVLLAALGRALTAQTGAARHVVDVERSGREPLFDDVDVSRTVGCFATWHPLALTTDDAQRPGATLRAVKQGLRSVPNGGIGWHILRQTAEPVPDAPTVLTFAYRGTVETQDRIAVDRGAHGHQVRGIAVNAGFVDDRLVICWQYATERHDAAEIAVLSARHREELLAVLAEEPGLASMQTPSDFPLARVDQAQLDDLLSRL